MKKYINSSYSENGSDNDYNFGSKALDTLDDEHDSIIEHKIKRYAEEAYVDIENLLDYANASSDADVSRCKSYVLEELNSIRKWTDTLEEMVTEAVDEYNESIASI